MRDRGGMAVPVLSEVAGVAPNSGVAALKYSAHAFDQVRGSRGFDTQGLKGCAGRTRGTSRPARPCGSRRASASGYPARTPRLGLSP